MPPTSLPPASYERIFASSPAPAAVARLADGRFVDANDAFLALHGYTRGEILQLTGEAVVVWATPDEQARFRALLHADGKATNFPLVARHRSGRRIDVLLSAYVTDIDGEPHVVGHVTDVSGLVQAQASLREALERYRGIFGAERDAILVVAQDTLTVVDANEAAARMYGWPLAELVGMKVTDLSADAAVTQRSIAGSETVVPLRWHRRRDGTRFPVEISASYLDVKGRHLMVGIVRDLTERRAAEARQRLMALVLDQLQDHVTITDLAGNVTYTNLSEVQSLGRNIAAAGGHVRDFGHDERADATQDEIARVTLESGAWRGRVVNRREDGNTVLLDLRTSLVRDEAGTPVAMVGVGTDVSAQVAAEEARTAGARQLAAALAAMTDGVFIVDAAGRLLHWNEAALAVHRFPPGTDLSPGVGVLAGRMEARAEDGTLVPPERRAVARALAGEGATDVEYALRRADTGEAWLASYSFAPIRDERGAVVGAVVSARDITERKAVEAQLRSHRSELEALVGARTADLKDALAQLEITQFAMDRVGIGITWVDAATGRFVYVNRSAAEMLGYTPGEMQALALRDVDTELEHTAYTDMVAHIRAVGTARLERTGRTKDGREIAIEITVDLRPATDGTPERLIGFMRDITERKANEEALVAAKAAAEAANVAKGRFLANMSHEIRTPLNGVLGMAELVRRTGVTPRQADYLDKIESSGRHLLRIINDILDLSKIDAHKVELVDEDFRLPDLVRDLGAMIGDRIHAKGLAFRVDIAGAPVALRGPRTQIAQALLNYLDNAVKFTDRGHVTLACRVEAEDATACLLRFEVQDTGRGMTAEQQERVFDAFEQADPSTTREFGGTGLGLTITRRIAQMLGGSAGVTAAPGTGTGSTFWFTARLARARSPAEPPARAAAPVVPRSFGGARVLLAEDEPTSCEVATEFLRDVELEVDVAGTGTDAVRLAQAHDYALILLDIQMPGLDGIGAARAIRALPGRAHTPIVAMTANFFAEDRARCLAAGMDDFLAKPVESQVLYATIARWIGRRAS